MKILYQWHTDCHKWVEKTGFFDSMYRSKDVVRNFIKKETGLSLDFLNSADRKEETSADGKEGFRFFFDEPTAIISKILSKPSNVKDKEAILKLHKQLSIILQISCTRKINVERLKQCV